MNETALQTKMPLANDALNAPDEDLLPLRWSVPVWLALAAASWGAVYFVLSLIL